MKNYKCDMRYYCRIGISIIRQIQTVCGITHIGKTRYAQAALGGIPRRRLSLLVPEGHHVNETDLYLIEIGKKTGKYDHAERSQLSIRRLDRQTVDSMSNVQVVNSGHLVWDQKGPTAEVTIQTWDGGEHIHIASGPVLRTEAIEGAEGARQIIAWHWSRYYTHLRHVDVSDLLETFGFKSDENLNAANRRASRALYKRSRDLGFKKMTLRERFKHGLDTDSPCWQRISDVEARGSATGCGDYTLTVAQATWGV